MDIALLGMSVDSRDLDKANPKLDSFVKKTSASEIAAKKWGTATERAARQAQTSISGAEGVMRRLNGVMGALGAGAGIGGLVALADQYTSINNLLRVTADSQEAANQQFDALVGVANRTRAPLEAIASLYQRGSLAADDLGASQADMLRFTENVGLALAQQGGSAAAASGALMQLSQALGGGTVRAEEFNSMLEGAFPLVQAAARGIEEAGGSVSRLRALMIDGKISSQEFFDAILSQTDSLTAAFANTTPTIAQAFTVLRNNLVATVGSMDAMLGASGAVATAIEALGNNIARVITYATAAAAVFGARYVAALVGAAGSTSMLAGALTLLRGALARLPFAALIVAAGELAYQFIELSKRAGGFGNAMSLLGDVAAAVWRGIVDSAALIPPALEAVWLRIKAGFIGMVQSLTNAWGNFLFTLADNLRGVDGGLLKAVGLTDGVASKLEEMGTSVGESVSRMGDSVATLDGQIAGLSSTVSDGATKAFEGARTALGKLQATVSGTESGVTEAAAATERLANAAEGAAGKAGKLAKEGKTAAENAEEAAEATDQWEGAITGVAGAFGDFIANGAKDFGDFVRSIKDQFKRMIADLIATAASNRIMLAIGGTGAAGVAGAVAAPQGGVLGNLGAAGGIAGGLWGGASSVISGLASGGISGGIGAIGTALSGATTGLAGLAAAAGAIALPVAAVAAAFSFFKTKTKELDNGLEILADGAEVLVREFKDVEKSRFWGMSKKRGREDDWADEDVAAPIRKAYGAVRKSVMDMAGTIGLGSSALDDFATTFEVSLKGLTAEQAQEALAAEFERIGNSMARTALGGRSLVKAGEDASAALSRLSSSLTTANGAFETLGLRLFDVSLRGAAAASRMVEAAGGLAKFAEVSEFYFQNFYSASERAAEAQRQFNKAAEEAGVRAPKTEAAFRRTVDQLVEAGRTTAAGMLIASAPLFVEMRKLQSELGKTAEVAGLSADALREREGLQRRLWELEGKTGLLKRAELAALDPANRAMQVRIWALEAEASAADRAAKRAEEAAAKVVRIEEAREARARATADERSRLERRLLEVTGNTTAIRRLELAALNPANRALQKLIWARENEANAAERAAAKAEEREERLQALAEARAERAEAVADERGDLERQLLELQGNTTELRRRELATLSPANRALQRMIWGLEDAKDAMDALDPSDFASRLAFQRAQGRAASGMPVASPIYQPAMTSPVSPDRGEVIELRAVRREIVAMREEQRQLGMQTATATTRLRDLHRKWDQDGLPAERA
jgi:tape measure domain-containing protein